MEISKKETDICRQCSECMASRYEKNLSFAGRKEKDGFYVSLCSTGDWHQCVACKITEEVVQVRDTKDPDDTTLTFTHGEWRAFIQGVKNGEFDLGAAIGKVKDFMTPSKLGPGSSSGGDKGGK